MTAIRINRSTTLSVQELVERLAHYNHASAMVALAKAICKKLAVKNPPNKMQAKNSEVYKAEQIVSVNLVGGYFVDFTREQLETMLMELNHYAPAADNRTWGYNLMRGVSVDELGKVTSYFNLDDVRKMVELGKWESLLSKPALIPAPATPKKREQTAREKMLDKLQGLSNMTCGYTVRDYGMLNELVFMVAGVPAMRVANLPAGTVIGITPPEGEDND